MKMNILGQNVPVSVHDSSGNVVQTFTQDPQHMTGGQHVNIGGTSYESQVRIVDNSGMK